MLESGKLMPSIDAWLREAKADASAAGCGMYLTHNGVVRATPKAEVRMSDPAVPHGQHPASTDRESEKP